MFSFRSRKRRGSETLSEEEERSSGDETIRTNQRRGRRSGQRIRKEGRRRGEEAENLQNFPKMSLNQRTGSPIMTECTAAMVLMDLSGSPAGRVSHASGQSGTTGHHVANVNYTHVEKSEEKFLLTTFSVYCCAQ